MCPLHSAACAAVRALCAREGRWGERETWDRHAWANHDARAWHARVCRTWGACPAWWAQPANISVWCARGARRAKHLVQLVHACRRCHAIHHRRLQDVLARKSAEFPGSCQGDWAGAPWPCQPFLAPHVCHGVAVLHAAPCNRAAMIRIPASAFCAHERERSKAVPATPHRRGWLIAVVCGAA